MITYERYCQDCKKFKIENPYKSESDFNRAYGIDQHREPLIITPRNQKRPMKATFENSEKPVVKKSLTTEKSDHIREVTKKVSPPKKSKAQTYPQRELTRQPNAVKRTSLKGMSAEEKKAHKRKLSMERYAQKKQNGTLKPRSETQLEKQRRYSKEYYYKHRQQRLEAVRIKRQNMTSEQKQKLKEYMSQWQKQNREHVNARAREWKRTKRSAKNNTFTLAEAS